MFSVTQNIGPMKNIDNDVLQITITNTLYYSETLSGASILHGPSGPEFMNTSVVSPYIFRDYVTTYRHKRAQ